LIPATLRRTLAGMNWRRGSLFAAIDLAVAMPLMM
jgi:hypothetical protein